MAEDLNTQSSHISNWALNLTSVIIPSWKEERQRQEGLKMEQIWGAPDAQ